MTAHGAGIDSAPMMLTKPQRQVYSRASERLIWLGLACLFAGAFIPGIIGWLLIAYFAGSLIVALGVQIWIGVSFLVLARTHTRR